MLTCAMKYVHDKHVSITSVIEIQRKINRGNGKLIDFLNKINIVSTCAHMFLIKSCCIK